TMSEEQLAELCLEGLGRVIPQARRKYLGGCRVLKTPIAYPVYLLQYEQERLRLAESVGVEGLYSTGRNGEFAHILMEDVYWRTLRRMRALAAQLHDVTIDLRGDDVATQPFAAMRRNGGKVFGG